MKITINLNRSHLVGLITVLIFLSSAVLTGFKYANKDKVESSFAKASASRSSFAKASADKKWKWEEMYPSDMREAIKEKPVAWVLFSPLEWHGEAMSFGTDPIIGQHAIDIAWNKVGGVRIPTMLLGAETDYKYFGERGLMSHWGLEQVTKEHNYGSLYVRPSTLQMVVEDYLYFLKREGFKIAVISTGHGAIEHVKVMKEVCERYTDDDFKAVFFPYWGAGNTPDELKFEGSGGHADFSELSLLGAVNPNMVDVDKFGVTEQDRKVKLLKENKDKIDFEKAKKLIEFRANGMAEAVQRMIDEMEK